MFDFIFQHGTNPWNYLPPDDVRKHLQDIATNDTFGVLAEHNGALVGFATCNIGNHCSRYEAKETGSREQGYIAEVVVHRNHVGQGIGTRLLEDAKNLLLGMGVTTIYIERHEENMASAGMMRKAGFMEVDTFFDPERRFVGSRKTTVMRFR